MKKVGLAILLTVAAGFVGALAGLLLALVISEPLNAIFEPDEWGLSGAVTAAMIFLPILGGITSIAFCWRRVYHRTDGFKKSRKSARCLQCGYILYKTTSNHCPECGRAIEPKQQKHLKRIERRNA